MFIASLVCLCGVFAVNVVFYLISSTLKQDQYIIAIVIISVLGGILSIPIIVFFFFHLYLCISGRTTREVMKSIKKD